jgi:uncharacterized MnhB-related membrane protein
MSWEMMLHYFLLVFLLIICIIAIEVKDLLYAAIMLCGASAVIAVLFYILHAPDIAITQAAVDAGIATVLYIVAISRTRREE